MVSISSNETLTPQSVFPRMTSTAGLVDSESGGQALFQCSHFERISAASDRAHQPVAAQRHPPGPCRRIHLPSHGRRDDTQQRVCQRIDDLSLRLSRPPTASTVDTPPPRIRHRVRVVERDRQGRQASWRAHQPLLLSSLRQAGPPPSPVIIGQPGSWVPKVRARA